MSKQEYQYFSNLVTTSHCKKSKTLPGNSEPLKGITEWTMQETPKNSSNTGDLENFTGHQQGRRNNEDWHYVQTGLYQQHSKHQSAQDSEFLIKNTGPHLNFKDMCKMGSFQTENR